MNFTTGLFLSLFATQQVTPTTHPSQGIEKTHDQSTKVQHTSQATKNSFNTLQVKNNLETLDD